jgi:cation diffusion facilitator CzcD-associated flavoprotein CzcO
VGKQVVIIGAGSVGCDVPARLAGLGQRSPWWISKALASARKKAAETLGAKFSGQ